MHRTNRQHGGFFARQVSQLTACVDTFVGATPFVIISLRKIPTNYESLAGPLTTRQTLCIDMVDGSAC